MFTLPGTQEQPPRAAGHPGRGVRDQPGPDARLHRPDDLRLHRVGQREPGRAGDLPAAAARVRPALHAAQGGPARRQEQALRMRGQ